jgi:hypothetical protein
MYVTWCNGRCLSCEREIHWACLFFNRFLFMLDICVFQKKNQLKPFFISHLLIGIIAVFVFGFNPYVTNMLNRGNPFYPVMGSKAFPKASDTNEKFETPHNMKGKSLLVRLFYANFGEPGNAPYNKEVDARLALPFTSSSKLWKAYDFQETSASGFGPYFGILLVLTVIILPIILITIKAFRLPALIFFTGLCCCLSLSKHFWWPRFFRCFGSCLWCRCFCYGEMKLNNYLKTKPIDRSRLQKFVALYLRQALALTVLSWHLSI